MTAAMVRLAELVIKHANTMDIVARRETRRAEHTWV
jgi:hypothetical protein